MSQKQKLQVTRDRGTLMIAGEVSLWSYKRILAGIYEATSKAGYSEVTLDLTACERFGPAAAIAVCAQTMALRHAGVAFRLELPKGLTVSRAFTNANWAHLIDPRQFDPATKRYGLRLPATNFRSATEQNAAVNAMVSALLAARGDLDRAQLQAFEWSINEITDNVLVHAESRVGGLVQVSLVNSKDFVVEFDVCDPGIGIPASLRRGIPAVSSDTEALDRAIREGVTRDPKVGQGNGLFGTYQVCAVSGGQFQIHSGYANLSLLAKDELHVNGEQIPYAGTLIVARISFARKGVLDDALRFGGKKYVPVDFIESQYEDGDIAIVRLAVETASCGSRIAGTPVRNRLLNLLRMSSASVIQIDFEGVPIMSSSFADEVFGKLFVEIGPTEFMTRIRYKNLSSVARNLIDKAIVQRVRG